MHNQNRCRHLRIKENPETYRQGGGRGAAAAFGSQRHLFLCDLPSRRRGRCAYMSNRADECPDYEESK